MVNAFVKSKENAKRVQDFKKRVKKRGFKNKRDAKFESNKYVDKSKKKQQKGSDDEMEQLKEEDAVSDIEMEGESDEEKNLVASEDER